MKDEKNGGKTRLRKGLVGGVEEVFFMLCVCDVIGQMMGWGRGEA